MQAGPISIQGHTAETSGLCPQHHHKAGGSSSKVRWKFELEDFSATNIDHGIGKQNSRWGRTVARVRYRESDCRSKVTQMQRCKDVVKVLLTVLIESSFPKGEQARAENASLAHRCAPRETELADCHAATGTARWRVVVVLAGPTGTHRRHRRRTVRLDQEGYLEHLARIERWRRDDLGCRWLHIPIQGL